MLLLIKTNEKQHRKLFEELTGAKFIGQSKEKNRTIYINSDSTNMQAISTLLRTKIKTGNVIAAIATTDDKDTRQGDCERIELSLQYEFTEGAKYFIQIEADEQDINIKESLEEGTEIGDFVVEEIDFEQIENGSNKTFPAIITKTFGNGKAVLFTFEVDKVQEKEKIENIINNAITKII